MIIFFKANSKRTDSADTRPDIHAEHTKFIAPLAESKSCLPSVAKSQNFEGKNAKLKVE